MAADPTGSSAGPRGGSLAQALRTPRAPTEYVVSGLLALCAAVSVLTTVGIVGVLLFETITFFGEVSFAEFFGDTQWTPLFADPHFGIWPLVSGTILATLIACAVAVPLGLMAAIFLAELVGQRTRKTLKPILEVLAGVPTVVYGYFALTFVTPLLQHLIPGLAGFNALSPGIVMGVMILPMVASLSDDAIYAVPNAMREGAYALGSTRLRSIFKVVLPSAQSGIIASVVLAFSRAIGETMIVTIAAGQQPRLTFDPRVPIETMTAFIVQVSLGDTPTGTLAYKTIFAVGAALFVLTLGLNLISYRFRRRMLKRMGR